MEESQCHLSDSREVYWCGRTRVGRICNVWPLWLQAMLNPEWRLRPTAESVLQHPWLTGQSLEKLQEPPDAIAE